MNQEEQNVQEVRKILLPHDPPADADEFLASCSEIERELHKLAVEKLGSSYFMEKSHGYKAWKAKQGQQK